MVSYDPHAREAIVYFTYKVLKLELGKGVIKSSLDRFGVVLCVPKLGGNEYVLTLDAELLEGALDALSDLLLVLVAGWWNNSSVIFPDELRP